MRETRVHNPGGRAAPSPATQPGGRRGDHARLLGVAASLLALLAGCALNPPLRETPASYDLGPGRSFGSEVPHIRASLLVPAVSAPAWLDRPDIVYRLAYQDAARPQPYANSRWSAAPAALLTQRLRSRFAAASARGIVVEGDGVRGEYALRFALEDFTQIFDSPQASRVSVRLRASLIDVARHALLAQRTFVLERAAASPDAAGAVRAFGAAADELADGLVEWVALQLKGR